MRDKQTTHYDTSSWSRSGLGRWRLNCPGWRNRNRRRVRGLDEAPTITNPSFGLPMSAGRGLQSAITPSPRLNNASSPWLSATCSVRKQHNAMVLTRGMQRDYDEWAKNGAKGWASPTCFRSSTTRRLEAGATSGAAPAGRYTSVGRGILIHSAAFIDAAREMVAHLAI